MSIQKINQYSANLATKFLKNKTVLNTLEKISKHPASFTAGVSLGMSLIVRPVAIYSTPDVEKENKQYAIANSMSSGLMKFAIVEAVALPIENALRRIDDNPEKFLKPATLQNLKQGDSLANSKSYKLLSQFLKLTAGFLAAVPKSVLTVALIPIIMDKLFSFKNNKQPKPQKTIETTNKDINFKGLGENLSKGIGKIIDKNWLQNLAVRFQNNDKDIAKHMTAATDILLTTTATYRTLHSDEIKQNRKKALVYNNIISTGITLSAVYGIDRIFKNKTGKFIEKFKQLNANEPKLHKYVEGLNILRPALIAAFVYYGILPMFSTYMAEKIDKFIEKGNKKS